MDFNSLKDTVSNLTLYDVKAGVRKVQNAVMNYTEMESKVREATNNEPWGASSTLMQEIANGTFHYQTLNEIMPMIYRRFTEKAAEEWRQIYKALQLLEFLIKHGSERVIDDARGHVTLLKMLRQFHFIDQNGKDQGINVRNRAKELAELLGDVERIRSERKKARANKAKYTGVEGGAMGGFSSSSSAGRYGGFGSESAGYGGSGGGSSAGYGGYTGGVYGDGGGFGGQEPNDFSARGNDRFDEYDEYDEAETGGSSSRTKRPETTQRAGVKKTTPSAPPKKAKEPEVDLFSFDDPEPTPSAPAAAAPAPAASSSGIDALASNDDDDFDDFQSATPATQTSAPSNAFSIAPPMVTSSAQGTAQFAAPQPLSGPQNANITSMMSAISPPASANATPAANYSAFSAPTNMMSPQAPKPTGYQPAQPNYFQSVQTSQPAQQVQKTNTGFSSASGASGMSAFNKPAGTAAAKPAAGGDPFANLFTAAGGGAKKNNSISSGPKLGQLAKEKTSASLWGAPSNTGAAPSKPAQSTGSSGLDDLLG